MQVTVNISNEHYEHFKLIDTSEDHEERLPELLSILFMKDLGEKEKTFPYRVIPVPGTDQKLWNIYYVAHGEFRPADGCTKPFAKDRVQNAERKARTMNKKWWQALRETEANMAKHGGAIIV